MCTSARPCLVQARFALMVPHSASSNIRKRPSTIISHMSMLHTRRIGWYIVVQGHPIPKESTTIWLLIFPFYGSYQVPRSSLLFPYLLSKTHIFFLCHIHSFRIFL